MSIMKFALIIAVFPAVVFTNGLYSLKSTIPWAPKNSTSVDQGAVYNGTYYLSDRFNGVLHVVDLASATETTRVTGFVGAKYVNGSLSKLTSGPAGLLVVPDRNELYVGDGNGTVKIIDLQTTKIIDTINLGLTKRADEMAYDAKHQLAAITGPDEDIPLLFFVSVVSRKIVGKIAFPNATNGIEQPAWNPADGNIYLSIPETKANPGGEIDVIDPTTMTVNKILPQPRCNSAGIVFGTSKQLLLGCSQDSILAFNVGHTLIMNPETGDITSTINGVAGSDQVTYDPTTKLYYLSAYQMLAHGNKTGAPDPLLAIVNATDGTLVQTIRTDNITAHSVAVDPVSNNMIVPLAKSGIAIFHLAANGTGTSCNPTSSSTPSASPSTVSGATKAVTSPAMWLIVYLATLAVATAIMYV
jgi:WD40 repeat protein